LGMKTVWLNRYGLVCPDASMAIEINSYSGLNYKEIFM